MAKYKVLIAEDSKQIQLFYKRSLSDKIFELKIAEDGLKALDVYDEWKPDIILLDYMMPNLNGYQFLTELRVKRKDINTTVIVITSVSEKEDIMAFAKLGIQGFIVKPFRVEEIAMNILKYHKNHQSNS